mmetsp:Transcript_47789/g.55275  ORF Transcript_47789/g.55275 Transcript_47789/m.55275 type:complete len:110 (-) Transcript_47789:75-404(-)
MPLNEGNPTGILLAGSNFAVRQVESFEAENWAREHEAFMYVETSAKDNVNVAFAFQCLATAMVRKALRSQPPANTSQTRSSSLPLTRRNMKGLDERPNSDDSVQRRCAC